MSDEKAAVDAAAVQRAVRTAQLLTSSRRMQTGLSVNDAENLGRTLLALNLVANSAADLLAARDRMLAAGRTGNAAAEIAGDEEVRSLEIELASTLLTLGFISEKEEDNGQEG